MAAAEIAGHLQEIIFAFGHFSRSLWVSVAMRDTQCFLDGDERGERKKLPLLPSSLLWLLNLVQKELTSKGCSEIHNSRGSACCIVNPERGMSETTFNVKGILAP